MEEPEEIPASHSVNPIPSATSIPFSLVEDAVTTESMGVLQKAFFMAVILGCIAIYVRMSRVKDRKDQVHEKSLA